MCAVVVQLLIPPLRERTRSATIFPKQSYLQKMLEEMSKLGEQMMIRLYGDVLIFVPAFIFTEHEMDHLQHYMLETIHAIEFIAVAISIPLTMMHNYCLARSTFFHPNLARIVQVGKESTVTFISYRY